MLAFTSTDPYTHTGHGDVENGLVATEKLTLNLKSELIHGKRGSLTFRGTPVCAFRHVLQSPRPFQLFKTLVRTAKRG